MRTNQETASLLLTRTVGMGHGSYPERMEDEEGPVWEFIRTMGEIEAESTLYQAAKWHDPEQLLPPNRHFVIYQADNTFVYAVYRVDFRYHIVRASGARFYSLILRDQAGRWTDARHMVRTTLKEMYDHQLTDYHV